MPNDTCRPFTIPIADTSATTLGRPLRIANTGEPDEPGTTSHDITTRPRAASSTSHARWRDAASLRPAP
jgi:hypothetical protein